MLQLATKRCFISFREKDIINAILTLDPDSYYCTVNGKVVYNFNEKAIEFEDDDLFQLHFRVFGGKGGFGSLLRSFRVNKSTNQLMCRDLNGRRLASIDEEQKLRKWIERAAEREREKLEKRNAKYNKLKSGPPKHMFHDPEYMRQKEAIIEKTEEAFEQGLMELTKTDYEKLKPPIESSSDSDFDIDDLPGSLSTGRKRKARSLSSQVRSKKYKMESDSDSDSDVSDIDPEVVNEIREYFCNKSVGIADLKDGGFSLSKDQPESLPQHQNDLRNCSNLVGNVDEPNGHGEVLKSEPYPIVVLSSYENAVELEALGVDHLKHDLAARGMKCEGTLKEIAARLFSMKDFS